MAASWHFSREFKVEAVKLVTGRGVSIAQAAQLPEAEIGRFRPGSA